MNAEILKRLFRAVTEGSDESLRKVCGVIIEDVKRKHHQHLADQLEQILVDSTKNEEPKQVIKLRPATTEVVNNTLPQARRGQENLISIFSRQELEHYMVLPKSIEEKFVRIEQEYAARERLANYGLKARKKILLYGPPGCGKTLAAKRLAWNTGLKLVKVRFDVMISSLFGESANNLRTIFDFCSVNPSVLLLDECDFIARSRNSNKDIGEVQRIVNTLLQLLEDYNFPGLVIATTNLYEQLDHALFRRFDDAFEVPLPGEDEINKLLKFSFSTVTLDRDVDFNKISTKLKGYSSADVVKVAQNAAKNVVLGGETKVTSKVITQAINEFSGSIR
ncbi:MAG: AAA family ATPase [Steroidobacteraceae bacterium]